jgi:Holliday junction resolvasome RuvABC endonuclease subunit
MQTADVLLAIDPGANGGIAWYVKDREVSAVPMPDGMTAIVDFLRTLCNDFAFLGLQTACYMEKVGGHVKGNNASASCTFARHCGNIEAAMYCFGIPVTQVTPKEWMKHLGKMPADKAERKHHIRDEMSRLYPTLKVTLKTADALGILTYAQSRQSFDKVAALLRS